MRWVFLVSATALLGCVGDYSSFSTGTCTHDGPLWEVSPTAPPRTNRWLGCGVSTHRDSGAWNGHVQLFGVRVDGVEDGAGSLILRYEARRPPPVRLPVLGPEERYGGAHGAWITLQDEVDADVAYVPRGFVTLERLERERGESAGTRSLTPDRATVEIDFTGLEYVHERRGPLTLDGRVTFEGVQSGCFPEKKHHLPDRLGTYAPSSDNDCDWPLDAEGLGAAVPASTFLEGAACGACVALFSLGGEVTLPIVDVCDDCGEDQIRVDPAIKASIVRSGESEPANFVWAYSTCPDLSGVPLQYHFREDSTPERFAVQLRHIRHPIARVEVETSPGEFRELRREGAWLLGEGLGAGPFNTRVTSIFGHVVEDLAIPLRPGEDVNGLGQFRACYSDEE